MGEKVVTYEQLRAQAGPQTRKMASFVKEDEGGGGARGGPSGPMGPAPQGGRTVSTDANRSMGAGAVAARDRLRARVQNARGLVMLFQRLREEGVEPHPGGAWRDFEYATKLFDAVQPTPEVLEGTEAAVDPHPSLGLTNPSLCYGDDPQDEGVVRATSQYGEVHQVIGDLARVGVGVIRHLNEADASWDRICWASSSGTDLIVPPWEMEAHILGDDCRNMARFTWPLICGWWFGVQIIGILFNTGGGSPFGDRNRPYIDSQGAAYSWEQIDAQVPAHQRYLTMPAESGWHDWYWHDHSTHSSAYQAFGLNVYPTTTQDGASAYDAECARRKCLGIAAYADSFASYLERLDRVMQAWDTGIEEILPGLEYGNEMDHYWVPQKPGATIQRRAACEYGRFMAVLGGPIRRRFGARIRLHYCDLLGWTGMPPDWIRALGWLRASLSVGLKVECERLESFWTFPASNDHADDWEDTLNELNPRQWWPRNVWTGWGLTPAHLVQQVGLHFFHHTDHYARVGAKNPPAWIDNYRDEIELGVELQQLKDAITGINGLSLDWRMGAIGAVADLPVDPNEDEDQYYTGTTPKYQAGLVVRRLLYCLAQGARTVFHYTHMASLQDQSARRRHQWLMLASSGMRNDVYNILSSDSWRNPPDADSFEQEKHAWRRPAWFALRRLAWLMHQTAGYQIVKEEESEGLVLLLEAVDRYGSPEWVPGSGASRPWEEPLSEQPGRFALVLWQDELRSTASRDLEHTVLGCPEDGWRLLSLLPDVDPSGTLHAFPGPLDFPQGEGLDWEGHRTDGGGWTTATITTLAAGPVGGERLRLAMPRADPDENPAALCVLFDTTPRAGGERTIAEPSHTSESSVPGHPGSFDGQDQKSEPKTR